MWRSRKIHEQLAEGMTSGKCGSKNKNKRSVAEYDSVSASCLDIQVMAELDRGKHSRKSRPNEAGLSSAEFPGAAGSRLSESFPSLPKKQWIAGSLHREGRRSPDALHRSPER